MEGTSAQTVKAGERKVEERFFSWLSAMSSQIAIGLKRERKEQNRSRCKWRS